MGYIHPNLYKYRTAAELDKDYELLETEMMETPTLVNAYKAISKFATNIQCSHTFTNPWNQGPDVEKAIFHQADKVPFTFKRIGKRIFVDKNASADQRIKKGLEVLSINGVKTTDILKTLLSVTNADGSNDAMRYNKMQILGYGEHSTFDLYYSLFYSMSQGVFYLSLQDPKSKRVYKTSVTPLTFDKREKLMFNLSSNIPKSYDDLWTLTYPSEGVALLRLGTFVVWKMDMDWKSFMTEAFKVLPFISRLRYFHLSPIYSIHTPA